MASQLSLEIQQVLPGVEEGSLIEFGEPLFVSLNGGGNLEQYQAYEAINRCLAGASHLYPTNADICNEKPSYPETIELDLLKITSGSRRRISPLIYLRLTQLLDSVPRFSRLEPYGNRDIVAIAGALVARNLFNLAAPAGFNLPHTYPTRADLLRGIVRTRVGHLVDKVFETEDGGEPSYLFLANE